MTKKNAARRVTRVLLAVILVAGAGRVAAEHHIPAEPATSLDLQGRLAAFFELGDLDPMVELNGRFEREDREFGYRSAAAGAYYRAHKNVKLGAFYRLQAGVRHDDDWILSRGRWKWRDTADRWENVFILDATPRAALDFLPGRDWVAALKSRVEFNTFNGQWSLLLRPGLTYFHIVDREPVVAVTAAYGMYVPLNFGTLPFYEQAPYLSVLYHASRLVKLELSAAYKTVVWSTSDDTGDLTGGEYEVEARSWVIGLGVVLNVEP